MSDLPDYRREIVIVESVELDVVGSGTVDLAKVGGVTIATPTVAACVPISIENDAIAYDGVNDRFTIDIEKWSAAETVNVSVQNATIAVTQSGAWTVAATQSGAWTVAATQSGAWTVTVSGIVTANAGTNLNTSLLALEAGGNLAALVAKDFATQTTLAALNTKIPSDPAKESGKLTTIDSSLTTIAGKDFATQTTLAALNTKVPSDPAKESGKLTTIDASLTSLKAALGSIATDTLRVESV